MIHIVFQAADVETLQKSMLLDAGLQGEVLLIRDDYAVGPLQDIYSAAGISARTNWWREVLAGGDYDGLADHGTVDDPMTVAALADRLQQDPAETAWIWAAQNKHDVCGYYWLTSQLAPLQGRIFILYLNNLPFISDKGTLFYPTSLFQIPPREFLKAKKLARPITAGEFEMDADEWKRMCSAEQQVRLLEGGKKLLQFNESFYDQELLGFITSAWQKAGRLMHQFMNKAKHTTGDAFLLWRLKKMIDAQKIDFQGEPKTLKDFEVKLKISAPAELPFAAQ